jgi:hypothetical protein
MIDLEEHSVEGHSIKEYSLSESVTIECLKPLKFLTAIDTNTSGFVDRLYGVTESGEIETYLLESEDLRESKTIPFNFVNIKVESCPRVVKRPDGQGLWLIVLGKNEEGREGVFAIQDNSIIFLAEGSFDHFMIRYHRLILVPKSSEKNPIVLSLPMSEEAPKSYEITREALKKEEEDWNQRVMWRQNDNPN